MAEAFEDGCEDDVPGPLQHGWAARSKYMPGKRKDSGKGIGAIGPFEAVKAVFASK